MNERKRVPLRALPLALTPAPAQAEVKAGLTCINSAMFSRPPIAVLMDPSHVPSDISSTMTSVNVYGAMISFPLISKRRAKHCFCPSVAEWLCTLYIKDALIWIALWALIHS